MKKLFFALIICMLALQTSAQVYYYPDHSNTNYEGLRLYDNDSTFGINMRFRIQTRVGMTFDDEMNLQSSELLVRRLRLRFKGYMLTKKLTYAIQLGFSRGDQDWDNSGVPNIIRDAIVTYKPNSHFSIGMGQTKLPGNRERLISSGELQFVDRSNANARLTIDRDAGIFTSYENKLFGSTYILSGAFTSGKGRNPATNKTMVSVIPAK
jgi:phosphate-selective porin OprO and OprP